MQLSPLVVAAAFRGKPSVLGNSSPDLYRLRIEPQISLFGGSALSFSHLAGATKLLMHQKLPAIILLNTSPC